GCHPSHPNERAWPHSALADPAEKRPSVLGNLEIHLAAGLDAEAVANRLRDRHLSLARHCRTHRSLRNTGEAAGITTPRAVVPAATVCPGRSGVAVGRLSAARDRAAPAVDFSRA